MAVEPTPFEKGMTAQEMREAGYGVEASLMEHLEKAQDALREAVQDVSGWSFTWANRTYLSKHNKDQNGAKRANAAWDKVTKIDKKIQSLYREVKVVQVLLEAAAKFCAEK